MSGGTGGGGGGGDKSHRRLNGDDDEGFDLLTHWHENVKIYENLQKEHDRIQAAICTEENALAKKRLAGEFLDICTEMQEVNEIQDVLEADIIREHGKEAFDFSPKGKQRSSSPVALSLPSPPLPTQHDPNAWGAMAKYVGGLARAALGDDKVVECFKTLSKTPWAESTATTFMKNPEVKEILHQVVDDDSACSSLYHFVQCVAGNFEGNKQGSGSGGKTSLKRVADVEEGVRDFGSSSSSSSSKNVKSSFAEVAGAKTSQKRVANVEGMGDFGSSKNDKSSFAEVAGGEKPVKKSKADKATSSKNDKSSSAEVAVVEKPVKKIKADKPTSSKNDKSSSAEVAGVEKPVKKIKADKPTSSKNDKSSFAEEAVVEKPVKKIKADKPTSSKNDKSSFAEEAGGEEPAVDAKKGFWDMATVQSDESSEESGSESEAESNQTSSSSNSSSSSSDESEGENNQTSCSEKDEEEKEEEEEEDAEDTNSVRISTPTRKRTRVLVEEEEEEDGDPPQSETDGDNRKSGGRRCKQARTNPTAAPSDWLRGFVVKLNTFFNRKEGKALVTVMASTFEKRWTTLGNGEAREPRGAGRFDSQKATVIEENTYTPKSKKTLILDVREHIARDENGLFGVDKLTKWAKIFGSLWCDDDIRNCVEDGFGFKRVDDPCNTRIHVCGLLLNGLLTVKILDFLKFEGRLIADCKINIWELQAKCLDTAKLMVDLGCRGKMNDEGTIPWGETFVPKARTKRAPGNLRVGNVFEKLYDPLASWSLFSDKMTLSDMDGRDQFVQALAFTLDSRNHSNGHAINRMNAQIKRAIKSSDVTLQDSSKQKKGRKDTRKNEEDRKRKASELSEAERQNKLAEDEGSEREDDDDVVDDDEDSVVVVENSPELSDPKMKKGKAPSEKKGKTSSEKKKKGKTSSEEKKRKTSSRNKGKSP